MRAEMRAEFAACMLLAVLPAFADSFAHDIVPLFMDQCAGCHATGEEPGHLALTTHGAWRSLVGVPSTEAKLLRVKPGAPEQSYLMMKLDGTHLDHGGSGARMPFGGAALDAATRERIRAWIAAGAPNN